MRLPAAWHFAIRVRGILRYAQGDPRRSPELPRWSPRPPGASGLWVVDLHIRWIGISKACQYPLVQEFQPGHQPFWTAVGMRRSDCCGSLLRGERPAYAQPRKGEPDGGHCGANSLSGKAFELVWRGVGELRRRPARRVLAGVLGCS